MWLNPKFDGNSKSVTRTTLMSIVRSVFFDSSELFLFEIRNLDSEAEIRI